MCFISHRNPVAQRVAWQFQNSESELPMTLFSHARQQRPLASKYRLHFTLALMLFLSQGDNKNMSEHDGQ